MTTKIRSRTIAKLEIAEPPRALFGAPPPFVAEAERSLPRGLKFAAPRAPLNVRSLQPERRVISFVNRRRNK